MLEQRSEILSHYRRLDFFFFLWAITSAYFQKASTDTDLPDGHPYSRLWFLGHAKPTGLVHGESQSYLAVSPGPYPVALPFWMQELLHAACTESIIFEPAPQGSLQVFLPVPLRGSCYLSSIPLFLPSLPSSPQQGTPSSQGHPVEAGMICL